MINLSKELNNKQLEAVKTIDSPIRVIAGAGTGKTKMLTHRIAYLTEEIGTPSSRILAITFTNKAANEMRHRIRQIIGHQYFPFILTYHSFCVRFLREEINIMNWPINFTIIDEEDQKQIFKDMYKKLEIDKEACPLKYAKAYISHMKNTNVSPKESLAHAKNFDKRLLSHARLYEEYDRRLSGCFALDFDDLIVKTREILNNNETIRNKWSEKFDYVLVDEFQDTSDAQYAIINYISKPKQNLCVVGDPDQTIYTWRGANIDLILNLSKDFPKLKTFVLDHNYRSTQNILDCANSLIKNNKKRIHKDLFTRNEVGDLVTRYKGKSSNDESKWVINKINKLIKDGVQHNEIAIFYRSSYLSRQLEQYLVSFGIPYKVYGSFKFFQRKEIKDIISFLRVINIKDPIALERIINIPARNVGQTTIERLKVFSEKNNISLYDCLTMLEDIPNLPSKARNSLSILYANFEIYRNKAKKMSLLEMVPEFLDKIGYNQMMENDLGPSRKENVKELIQFIHNFSQSEENKDNALDKFLQEIAIYSAQDDLKDGKFISLMTIHISKGLEFEHVFLIGLNEEIFPSRHALIEGRIEEERRVCYVAMTRAKKNLYLSEASGYNFMTGNYRETSRFMLELDESRIEVVNKKYTAVGDQEVFDNYYDSSSVKDYKSEMYYDNEGGNPYHNDDIIVHKVFGEGVVLSTTETEVEALFPHPHKRKTLIWNHKSILRKKE